MRTLISILLLFSNGRVFSQNIPANVLNLQNWKLTIPFADEGEKHALEIEHPRLDQFQHPEAFFISDSGKAVCFRAHCGGATTKNSDYPRSELREMNVDGSDEIEWSTDDGKRHVLELEAAILHLPEKKPHLVCAQIHDASDDLIMIRLERQKLIVERNQDEAVLLDKDYQLGKKFTIQIVAESGVVQVFYQAEPKFEWKVSRRGCYFKAGCYTQSNTQKGDTPDAYGEVAIYHLKVSHSD